MKGLSTSTSWRRTLTDRQISPSQVDLELLRYRLQTNIDSLRMVVFCAVKRRSYIFDSLGLGPELIFITDSHNRTRLVSCQYSTASHEGLAGPVASSGNAVLTASFSSLSLSALVAYQNLVITRCQPAVDLSLVNAHHCRLFTSCECGCDSLIRLVASVSCL